jgi:hypothetical protein
MACGMGNAYHIQGITHTYVITHTQMLRKELCYGKKLLEIEQWQSPNLKKYSYATCKEVNLVNRGDTKMTATP